jgi:hypothetical protein
MFLSGRTLRTSADFDNAILFGLKMKSGRMGESLSMQVSLNLIWMILFLL